jgi:putative membrane protein
MKILSFILILAVLILGVTFAILNAEPVTVAYYFGTQQLPLSLIIAISFTIGLLLGLFVMMLNLIKYKTKLYRLKKRFKLAEKEIENLRTLPITGNSS